MKSNGTPFHPADIVPAIPEATCPFSQLHGNPWKTHVHHGHRGPRKQEDRWASLQCFPGSNIYIEHIIFVLNPRMSLTNVFKVNVIRMSMSTKLYHAYAYQHVQFECHSWNIFWDITVKYYTFIVKVKRWLRSCRSIRSKPYKWPWLKFNRSPL